MNILLGKFGNADSVQRLRKLNQVVPFATALNTSYLYVTFFEITLAKLKLGVQIYCAWTCSGCGAAALSTASAVGPLSKGGRPGTLFIAPSLQGISAEITTPYE